ncbi:MAG: hypothetical protein AB7P23_05700 [Amphiplicatus sp.]
MTQMFEERRRADDRERAAMIKKRAGIEDAIDALGLSSDLGVVSPCCEAIGAMTVARSGESAHCGFCGTNFDAIGLVRLTRECGFRAACEFLEKEVIGKTSAPRCGKTGDLFR